MDKDIKKRNEAYNRYVKEKIPKTKAWPSLLILFGWAVLFVV